MFHIIAPLDVILKYSRLCVLSVLEVFLRIDFLVFVHAIYKVVFTFRAIYTFSHC